MARRPTVGLALIVRDEADTLPALLASIDGAFDRVALLDTGSTDDTVAVFQAWAAKQSGMTFAVGNFEWVDDFAAARAAADHLLLYGPVIGGPPMVDWTCWADADDEIRGAHNLRELAASAPPELGAFGFGYDYARGPAGECVCYLKRERLVRAGAGRWTGRVHEAQLVAGGVHWVGADVAEWVHRKPDTAVAASSPRNRRILRAWAKDEPHNPRVLSYLGTEYAAIGKLKEALRWFGRYLKVESEWPEERAQAHRRMAQCRLALGDVDGAIDLALQALRVHPHWPDSYLTLAEGHYERGEYEKAAAWAERVLELGAPDTLLIINPLDYSVAPRVCLAGALGEMGRFADAIAVGERALQEAPHESLEAALQKWRAREKRERTAQRVIAYAQLLVTHDEQAKALQLLEDCVPHYAVDHPEVVACRSQIRERVLFATDPDAYAAHYADGGHKPEDWHTDEQAAAIAASLPRAAFLIEGLRDQAGA
jgi:tetratricopeptide (TPR) repeat protein